VARIIAIVFTVFTLLAAWPDPSLAQEVGALSTAGMDRVRQKRLNQERQPPESPAVARASAANCDYYLFTRPPKQKLAYTDPRLKDIAECSKAVKQAVEDASALEASSELNETLIRLRVSYKTLLDWIESKRPTPTAEENVDSWIAARKLLNEVGVLLPKVLRKHDLFAQFSAILVTGATLTDASQPEKPVEGDDDADGGDGEAAETGPEEEPSAVGVIVFQSRHFGDESLGPLDVSLGGRIGFQPILNLVAPATGAEDATLAAPTAVHQNAFVWNFAVQLNRQLRAINSEVGFFGKGGTTTLMTPPKAVDKGTGSFLAFPLDGGANSTAWVWESGVEFNMFDNRLEQIHAEKGGLSPQFQFLLAVRRDARFTGAAYESFESPGNRVLFRLTLDAIKVIDRRAFGDPANTFTFGFVVEYERSLMGGGNRVPPAARFVLRGNVDLLRAMTGADKPPKE